MMECRAIQDALPEYLAGRTTPGAIEIALHLDTCVECDAARMEIEAVLAILRALPEEPVSSHAEANARLRINTEIRPGPYHDLRTFRQWRDTRLRVCSVASVTGAVAVVLGYAGLSPSISSPVVAVRWAWHSASRPIIDLPEWSAAAALMLVAGVSALLPALLRRTSASVRDRSLRR